MVARQHDQATRSPEVTAAVRDAVARRPGDVARVLLELTTVVHDADDLQQLLQRTAEVAADVVDHVDSAGVTVVVGGRPGTAAATDARTLAVDAGQYETGQGPCLEAARTGEVVEVDVEEARERYPRFAREAAALGIKSFLAAPLVSAAGPIGALNLYSRHQDGFDALDAAVVQVLTRHAAGAVTEYLRYAEASTLAAQLEEAMRSRAVIEQAKGVLMHALGVDAEGAFAVLKRASQHRNVKLRDVAQEAVEAAARGEVPDAVLGHDLGQGLGQA